MGRTRTPEHFIVPPLAERGAVGSGTDTGEPNTALIACLPAKCPADEMFGVRVTVRRVLAPSRSHANSLIILKMRDVRNRNRIRALLYSRATLFGLGCVVVLLAVAVWNMYHTYRVATEKRADAKAEYESLAAHSGDLEERIARLQTARGRESRIREDFGLAREGEAMIIVTGAPDNQDREHVKKPGFFGAVLQSVRRFFE